MKNNEYPKLILPDYFDERAEAEALMKGYISGARVQLENGARYSVYFIDPVRLKQDLESETESGRPYIAEPGMIVLNEITISNIEQVLASLAEEKFFERLTSDQ